ncbi:hypothetical protein FE257_001643 [Aspergillus nanangensis]|uniref:SCD domain-containing protein n=1 Tax=Aspergillus nanangensis TaxID=2582783 RepID=A0AAD4CTQ4_ASPNN|nr:hypothetical protein FE257_001643 [Aspergillus nanangensis]
MDTESQLGTPHPEATTHDSASPSTDRRKSGRSTRRPELYSQTFSASQDAITPGGSKRKRATVGDENDEDVDDESVSESDESEENNDDPDEEELREKRRAARKSASRKAASGSKSKPKSRSAKKPKVAGNAIGSQLALRPAINGKQPSSRPRKPKVRPSLAAGESGLYAEVFGKGRNADTTAAEWLAQYQKKQASALHDMVNFILRCTGTYVEVTVDDILDLNHIDSRIGDLGDAYIREGISDYPLISKSRKFRAFQPVMEEFFRSLIQTLHHSSTLYDDPALYENINIWLAGFSSSKCRPFRHTATAMAIAVMSAFCGIAQQLLTSVSTSRKQVESEKRKKSVNKGRVEAIETAIEEGEKKLEIIDAYLKDAMNVVFVHRYRDVDPAIRLVCVGGLGQWMRIYREYFLDSQTTRYMGWMLSDTAAQIRSSTLAQLLLIFADKTNLGKLHQFAGRFRTRVVEIAVFDVDVGVRALAIELVGLIREAGLLEPSDIDIVGRLVFDAEPRIRKAAGQFFVANVDDVYDSSLQEVEEEANDIFGEEDEDEYESPKRGWIKIKCLADILQAYDELASESQPEMAISASRDLLSGAPAESRFVLATEAVYPHLKVLSQWQSLAGYLLYDHSQIEDDPSEDDAAGVVRQLYKLEEGQEGILLEVLCCAVKLRVLEVAKSNIDRRGRKVKALADKIPELQEEIAHNLAQIIPQLLNKFGSVPEAASAVLRLEHLIDLEKIQDIQKDATAYTSLLNDINKQFLTHSDQDVLAEASVAFLHAKSSDDMRDALDSKIQELWENTMDTLHTLSLKKEVAQGSSLSTSTLNELTNTLTRISNLASVTDCTQILESTPRSKGRKKDSSEAAFNILMHVLNRGLREEEDDEDSAKAELELVTSSMRTLLFYFMWKVQGLRAALSSGKATFDTAYFEALTKSRETFVATLVAIMGERSGLDDTRFAATTTLLDLQTLFSTLRNAGQTASNDEDVLLQTQSLVHEISADAESLIAKIHGVAERTYAKKIRLFMEPAEDDEPLSDSDIEKEPDDDDDDSEDEAIAQERLHSSLIAEQRLCELTGKIVLAIIGRVIDATGPQRGQLKQKLAKHKARLGQNYREVLAFIADQKPKRSRPAQSKGKQSAANKTQPGANKQPGGPKSAERVDEMDDEDNFELEHDPIEEDEEDDLQARGLVETEDIDDDDGDNMDNLAPPVSDEDEIMGD